MTNSAAGVAALHNIALYVQRYIGRDLYVLALDVALQPLCIGARCSVATTVTAIYD